MLTSPSEYRDLEALREKRDAAWAKVRRPNSTRFDLTKMEKLDRQYRDECARLGMQYHDLDTR